LSDGKPARIAVTLGLDDDTYTEIVGGELKPDDQVILSEQAGGSGKSAVPLPRL
jgi:HlyD family secretion protein